MKKVKLIPVFFIAVILLIGITAFGQNNPEKKAVKGFALLELYTSEGCSSCPPADELMGRIQNEYKDFNLYVLAYHVDYWDKQGWKDIFSKADYTKRQYDYAKFMEKDPIYTPQLIINGKIDYIASQETAVRNGIKSALSKSAVAQLSLDASQHDIKLNVNYNVSKVTQNNRLFIAVVQKSAKSNVKRGENAHRILSHYQIVRSLSSFALTGNLKGTASVAIPKDFNGKDYEIIGFVEDKNNGSILDATKAVLQQSHVL
ncbi:thioredoxin family protein [Flavobacterium sp. LC2016-12]|uniref:DUF1223 domain-containing protein n=1 Tax=Flavobacterium sp. LC2016-12 TaxID=2783794 RepID=UPI001889F3C5|nr:DUF1223 domain-containing protein [Flavobacterium sp. LC2016-12]MBF4465106.1 DUF1223 domain-containing protein [Flavobacterium sp. LC2016-12]